MEWGEFDVDLLRNIRALWSMAMSSVMRRKPHQPKDSCEDSKSMASKLSASGAVPSYIWFDVRQTDSSGIVVKS
jgi:hypothetical protein